MRLLFGNHCEIECVALAKRCGVGAGSFPGGKQLGFQHVPGQRYVRMAGEAWVCTSPIITPSCDLASVLLAPSTGRAVS